MRPVWPAALLAATLAASCDKLGLGNSGTNPNAPTPPAAGSTIPSPLLNCAQMTAVP